MTIKLGLATAVLLLATACASRAPFNTAMRACVAGQASACRTATWDMRN
jgi:hypothetical protein